MVPVTGAVGGVVGVEVVVFFPIVGHAVAIGVLVGLEDIDGRAGTSPFAST